MTVTPSMPPVGDAVRFVVNETSGTLLASQEVLGPNGNTICSSTTANQRDCFTSTDGVHTSGYGHENRVGDIGHDQGQCIGSFCPQA